MTKLVLKRAFYYHLEKGKIALQNKKFAVAFYEFENAHIIGQKHVYRHTISHYWMFVYGIKTKNFKEIFGQVTRILASIVFTLIWMPKGNTGGANVSPIKPMIIREDLKKYF